MTWKALMDLLTQEFRKLRKLPVVNFGYASQPVRDANELSAEELLCAGRLDAIIRDFARTRRWPALDDRERCFLRERVRFAYEYASLAEITVKRPLSIATRPQLWDEERRVIEWILIDVWRQSGVVNWLEPFYTLCEPAPEAKEGWDLQVSE